MLLLRRREPAEPTAGGYADDGGGVGIEFDPQGFRYFTGPDGPPFGLMRLWKVFYHKAKQREIILQSIQYPSWPYANEEERIQLIVDALQFFVPTFKNDGFYEEQERRLIFTPSTGIATKPRFRTRRGLLALLQLARLVRGERFRWRHEAAHSEYSRRPRRQ